MTPYESLAIALGFVHAAALIIVLVVYARQLNTMREQVDAVRQASAGQNLLALASFLQTEDVRQARTTVIEKLEGREHSTWDEREKRAAAKVCSSYTVAAILIELGLVPGQPMIDNWGPSVRRCHSILQGYMRELQKPENSGPTYWSAFDRLNSVVGGSRSDIA